MKKFLFIVTLFWSQIYAIQYCHDESGWCYDQSTFQSFYFLIDSVITYDYAEDSGGMMEFGDVLGAFRSIDPDGVSNSGDEYDACVGYAIYGVSTSGGENPDEQGVLTIPLMGNDGQYPDYLPMNVAPDLFKIFDISSNKEICTTLTGPELPPFQNNEMFNLYQDPSDNENGYGLLTITANNQDCDLCVYGIDNDDDEYVDLACDCSTICDCEGNPLEDYCDCNGGVEDNCGTCDSNPENDCIQDCNDVWGGDALEDDCGICDNNPNNDNITMDCTYDPDDESTWEDACGGTAEPSECGCTGGNSPNDPGCCLMCDDPAAINYDSLAIYGLDGLECTGDEQTQCVIETCPVLDEGMCVPASVDGFSAAVSGQQDDYVIGGQIALTWFPPEGNIASYEIERFKESEYDDTFTSIAYDGYYLDVGLDPLTVYNYRIRSVHNGGLTSDWSDFVTQTTLDLPIPTVVNIEEREERLIVNLSMPGNIDQYNNEYFTYNLTRICNVDYDGDGENDYCETEFIGPVTNLSYSDNNVIPGIEYCYTAVALYNGYVSGESNSNSCGVALAPSGWEVTVEASILGLGVFYEEDVENYFGMHPDATDGYDSGGGNSGDFPEPPPNPGNFIQLYFPHDQCVEECHRHGCDPYDESCCGDQFQSPFTDFTRDMREGRELSDNLESWDAKILSSMDGPVELKFIFDDWGQSIDDDDPPIKFPIYVLMDGEYELVEMPRCLGEEGQVDADNEECILNISEETCNGGCTWLEDECADILVVDGMITELDLIEDWENNDPNDDIPLPSNKLDCENSLEDYTWFGNNIIEYNSTAWEYKDIEIIVGNLPPLQPSGLTATALNPPEDPSLAYVSLTWDQTDECCQTPESRYPATHYYIYRVLSSVDDENTPEVDESQVWKEELIDNCNTVSPDGLVVPNGPVINTYSNELDEFGQRIVINPDFCEQNRYDFKGIVPADRFSYVDSTLDLRAIGFLNRLGTTIPDDIVDDPSTLVNEEDQWLVENARYIFETEFRYRITAVNEDFKNSDLEELSSGVQGTESEYSIEVSALTRTNLNPVTRAGNDQMEEVRHDGYHLSQEEFQDTGLDGQPGTLYDGDFLDYGSDGIKNQNEPLFHPLYNKDPNGDDWDPGTCSNGIYNTDISCEEAGGEWTENLDGTEGNGLYDVGEPGEGDGKFTFLDYGSDRTPSENEDGYDPGTCSNGTSDSQTLCEDDPNGVWTENLDPRGDDWDPDDNPYGTEGNFKHDVQEYSEQFYDTGCPGCSEEFTDCGYNDDDIYLCEGEDIDGDNESDWNPSFGNGVYDVGEPFIDCHYDLCDGDPGFNSDIMGNGEWDSAINNGVWDGNKDYITIFLDGSESSDPEYGYGESALNFVWRQISGPNVFLNTRLDMEPWIDCGYNNDGQYICEGDIGWDPSFGNGQWDEGEIVTDDYDGNLDDYYYGGKVEPFFNAVVPYGSIQEVYEFTLTAEDTYFKGWPPVAESHQFPESVQITVNAEDNVAPSVTIDAFIPGSNDLENTPEDSEFVLCVNDWECDYSVYEYDEEFPVFFDFSNEDNILGPTWRIEHDGDPYTNLAVLGVVGEFSRDNKVPNDNGDILQEEYDEIFFNWITGSSPEPYNDYGSPPNGQYDSTETFFDLNGNGIWDGGDPYSGKNIVINRSAREHVIYLTVSDVYGAEDLDSISLKVLPEKNEKPYANAGSNQTWYLDEFASTHRINLPYSDLEYDQNNDEYVSTGIFKHYNLSYDPDTLRLFDCGLDGLCDQDEPGFSFYGPDGEYNTGDENLDPHADGCSNPDFYFFEMSNCQVGPEGNGEWDGPNGEYIDYDKNGEYTQFLGDGVGEQYYRDELTYNWYLSNDLENPIAEGDTVSVDLGPGDYMFYLEVCDPYEGYEHSDFDPFTNQWIDSVYDGCSIDSVNITVLDEEPPGKPSWVSFPSEPLTRSLYYMDLDWKYNVDTDCVGRTDFLEECKPGFVDKYQIYRNGQLINTYDAWVDGNGDGVFELDAFNNNNNDWAGDVFIDCQYVCEGTTNVCSSNSDCDFGQACIIENSCEKICNPDLYPGQENACFDYTNFIDNDDFWLPNMGNGWYDPPEELIEDLNCSGTYEGEEEYTDANNNGQWDPAEEYTECNEEFTVCFGDPGWDAIQDTINIGEYDLGEPFVDVNGNGVRDTAEVFIDSFRPQCDSTLLDGTPKFDENGNLLYLQNGQFDYDEPYEDWNDNGHWDSGDIFVSGEIYPWLDVVLDEWDPGRDGYSGDYIRSYPNYRDDGENDSGLMPNTEYCYFVVAVNSSGISSYPSDTECAYTALLPSINITTPNGAEIYTKGEPFDVKWNVSDGRYLENNFGVIDTMEGDGITSYIENISIEYRIGDFDYPSNGENEIWYTNDYKNLENANTAQVSIYDLNDIAENNVEIRISITDVGGYSYRNPFQDLPDYQYYTDESDNKFTLSTTRLSYNFDPGWSLFGCPLDLSSEENTYDNGTPVGNGIIANLGTVSNLGDFGISWFVYNENGEFPQDEEDTFPLLHGKGYILTLNQASGVTLNGGVVNYEDPDAYQQNATLTIEDGWNLISNMLVSDINKNNIVVETFGQSYSWDDAVNFGFVQSELHGWNNAAQTYESIDKIKPWEGYWIHASRELDIKFRPHVPDSMLQRESRAEVWALKIRARSITNGASGDYVSLGLSDSASVGFRYGEDEYDTPLPLGDKYVNLFFDKSNWVGSEPDINGNELTETEFYREIRPYSALEEPNYWHLSSFTYADVGVDGVEPWYDEDEVELSWNNFDAIIGLPENNIYLHVDDNYYDMKIEDAVILSNIMEREITIQIGGDSPLAYDSVGLPTHFSVSNAYPNPFNPIANLDYAIAKSDNVKITVFNINGQLVETLVDEFKIAGYYQLSWEAYNISSGIYFIKVESGQNVSTQKLMLMK